MNKFDFNIEKYSCNELKDIFDIDSNSNETNILAAMEGHKNNILIDTNLALDQKNSITIFLNQVSEKLLEPNDDNSIKNILASNAPLSHPIILNPGNIERHNVSSNNKTPSLKYPRGYVNPIKIKFIKKTLNIDTRFRPMYYTTKSTDFFVTIPAPLKKITSMRLVSLDIPLTIYTINKQFKNMNFGVELEGSGAITNIVIPEGNYASLNPPENRCPYIKDVINALLVDAFGVGVIECDIETNNQKLIFSHLGGLGFTLYFNIDPEGNLEADIPLPLKLGWLLGFRAGKYNAINSVVKSEAICLIIGPRYLYLSIDDFTKAANNDYIAAFETSTISPNILVRLNYQSLVQTKGVYKIGESDDFMDTFSSARDYFGPVDIQKLHFQLLDEYGRVLDLNNMDWSCALTFDEIYD